MSQSLKATAKGSKAPQTKERGKDTFYLTHRLLSLYTLPPPSCNLALRVKEFLRLKRLIQDNEDLCAKKGLTRP